MDSEIGMQSRPSVQEPQTDDSDASARNEPGLSARQTAETRLWLQVLNVHKLIYGDLNAALNARFGLSVAKFDVMAQLHRYPDGLAIGDLSKKLKVTNGNVSGLVTRLRKDGYVDKQITASDRRSLRASLTAKGRLLFEEANRLHRQVVSQKLQGVSLQEIDAVTGGLKALTTKARHGASEQEEHS